MGRKKPKLTEDQKQWKANLIDYIKSDKCIKLNEQDPHDLVMDGRFMIFCAGYQKPKWFDVAIAGEDVMCCKTIIKWTPAVSYFKVVDLETKKCIMKIERETKPTLKYLLEYIDKHS